MSGKKRRMAVIGGMGAFVLLATAAVFIVWRTARAREERFPVPGAPVESGAVMANGYRMGWENLTAEYGPEREQQTRSAEDTGRPGGSRPAEGNASEAAGAGDGGQTSETGSRAETSSKDKVDKTSEDDGAAAGQGSAAAAGGYYGPLQVVGASLCDSKGDPVQLRGVSTHGIAWFPEYVNEALFQELHEQWNANVVRLAMYTAESGGYCTGGDREQLKQLVKDGVEYASAQNMYVIIDWHILSDGDPNTYREEAKSFFSEMSAEYGDRDNVLYEICNEPNGGTSWSRVKEYAEEIIPVIRENDEDAVILVGTPNWCQYVDQAAADPVTGWDNIMYTLHFYAATHKESLRRTYEAAVDAGLPVFVSEFSICDASGNGGIDGAQADAWVETLDRHGTSYVAWSLSNKNETSALIKSSCGRTDGLSAEDLSSTGSWLYGVLTGGQGSLPEKPFTGSESQSSAGNGGSQQGGGAQSSAGDEEALAGVSAGSEDLLGTLRLANSWESNGQFFYQYEMTVENLSDHTVDGWSVDVAFGGDVTLSDSWNGNCVTEGNILHVSSVDYNGQLESGASAENIGFIVISDGAPLP